MSTKLGKLLGTLLLSGALAASFSMGGCSSDVSPPPTGAGGNGGPDGSAGDGGKDTSDASVTDTHADAPAAETSSDAPAAETASDATTNTVDATDATGG